MWLLYSLATVLLTTVLALLFRKVSLNTKDQRAFSFIQNSAVTMLLFLTALFVGVGTVDLSSRTAVLVIAGGVSYGMFQRYQFLVRKHIEASILQTILTPTTIPAYILAIVWLGESLTIPRVAGYIIILIATFLVTNKPGKKYSFNAYVVIALFIGSIMSIGTTISKQILPAFESVLTYSLILWAIQSVFCYVPFIQLKSITKEIYIHRWTIVVIAVISTLATGSMLLALRHGNATQVIPITSSNVIFISIAGVVFLRERSRVGIKLLSASLSFIGLLLISL